MKALVACSTSACRPTEEDRAIHTQIMQGLYGPYKKTVGWVWVHSLPELPSKDAFSVKV